MAKRRKMNRKKSNRNYKSGHKVKSANTRAMPMRGGWRL